MYKKVVSIVLAIAMMTSISVFAEGTTSQETVAQTEIPLTSEATVGNDLDNAISIDSSGLTKTGETINISKQRAGQNVTNQRGVLSGTLTTTNTWDYYLFSSPSNSSYVSKITSSNSKYTMTLGELDMTSGIITLYDFVLPPNQVAIADLLPGNYAWVIQSSDATYGTSYQLQYNRAYTKSADFVYVSGDLQKLYAVTNQKFTLNGQVQNIDYKYDSEWDSYGQWHKIHIWMENANISFVHAGGVKHSESQQITDYPNAILLALKPGGLLTHKFTQNPPYINWGNNDAWGIETPRALNAADFDNNAGHYLIYDLTTGKVEEFASGLSKTWSSLGDKYNLVIY